MAIPWFKSLREERFIVSKTPGEAPRPTQPPFGEPLRLVTDLCLVQRLRMGGAMLRLPHMPSWRVLGHGYFLTVKTNAWL
jgi:hypothetical protein